MYHKNEKKEIFLILLLVCIVFIFSLFNCFIFQKTDKEIYSQAIEGCMSVEIEYLDETMGKGTAQLIDSKNAITVAHLFSKEVKKIKCYFYGKKDIFLAEIMKLDKDLDLALLKLGTNVNYKLKFAAKNDINFGREIFKFGNALGYGISFDKGVISNPYLKLEISGIEKELIAISICVNSGDSGGAVFSKKGLFVGTITFKTTPTLSTTDSMSFIIPSYIIFDFIRN